MHVLWQFLVEKYNNFKIVKAIENKQNVDVIYLDISRAFTCVPHNHVLSKIQFWYQRFLTWLVSKFFKKETTTSPVLITQCQNGLKLHPVYPRAQF